MGHTTQTGKDMETTSHTTITTHARIISEQEEQEDKKREGINF